jgi:MYXO-CTERM domain-containing protein
MHVLPWDDPRVEAQLRADLDAVTPVIELRGEGGAYFLKNLAAAALARGQDPAWRPRIEALLEQVASHATPAGHFGEVTLVRDGRAEQRVSTPHLWEGVLFYLTAMALEAPERILRYDAVLPALEAPGADAGVADAAVPDAATADAAARPDVGFHCADCGIDQDGDDGCDCRVAAVPPGSAALALLALAALRPRRRH